MTSLADLTPGTIMFGPIGGLFPGIFPIAAGQLLFAPAEMRRAPRDWWRLRHVAVIVEPGARIVQAMPFGAEEVEIGAEHWTPEYLYIRPQYAGPSEARAVATAARRYVGTPYSFTDYLVLALHRAGIRSGALRRYVTDSKRMICSQLADQALSDAGFHVFDDGRLSQDVMPAELACKLLSMPGEHLRPGQSAWMGNASWPLCCRDAVKP